MKKDKENIARTLSYSEMRVLIFVLSGAPKFVQI